MSPRSPSKPSWGIDPTTYALGTYSGRIMDVRAPKVEDLSIEDIAHSLSLQCRFGGHCKEFYSVAQHCVEVSKRVPEKDALWGLLHDASEAYLCDLPRPVKKLFPKYKEYENSLLGLVSERFGLSKKCPASVKRVDEMMLVWEAKWLHKVPIKSEVKIPSEPVVPKSPWQAERAFLERFYELTESN